MTRALAQRIESQPGTGSRFTVISPLPGASRSPKFQANNFSAFPTAPISGLAPAICSADLAAFPRTEVEGATCVLVWPTAACPEVFAGCVPTSCSIEVIKLLNKVVVLLEASAAAVVLLVGSVASVESVRELKPFLWPCPWAWPLKAGSAAAAPVDEIGSVMVIPFEK